jgi:hypothetical protein
MHHSAIDIPVKVGKNDSSYDLWKRIIHEYASEFRGGNFRIAQGLSGRCRLRQLSCQIPAAERNELGKPARDRLGDCRILQVKSR